MEDPRELGNDRNPAEKRRPADNVDQPGVAGQPPRQVRLIDAAEWLFARRGFAAATVPDIAAAAGVSAGLLYRYFPSKSALVVAIVERDMAQTVAAVQELAAAQAEPWAAMVDLVHGWIAVALADREGCALIAEIGAQACRDPAVAAVVVAAEAEIVAHVAALVAAACPQSDAQGTAVALLAALDGLVSRIAIDPAFDPLPAATALLAALEGLRG